MSSQATTKSAESGDVEAGKDVPQSLSHQSLSRRAWDYLQTQVDSKECVSISIYACFLTGYTSAISFSACFIWCVKVVADSAQNHNGRIDYRSDRC
jgi:hypothetical protein